jgi:hypothetical protein
MAIGNQTTYSVTSLNAEMGTVAVNFHNAADHAQDFFERIRGLGVQGLKDIGFDPVIAQTFFDTANLMNTAALVWFGQAAQTPASNFDDATAKAR